MNLFSSWRLFLFLYEMATALDQLLSTFPYHGQLGWIGIRPGKREPLISVEAVEANTESGLVGDHFAGKRSKKRQVTLIQQEHLPLIASVLQRESVEPALLRRNLAVSGINLLALKNKPFRIGEVTFQGTGLCHPCSRMEEIFGPGGYHAVFGHGGITAQIIQGGTIRLGDAVSRLEETD